MGGAAGVGSRQLLYAGFVLDLLRRMYADRGIHVRATLRNGEQTGQTIQLNGYAEQVVHPRGVRGSDGCIEIAAQRGKIEAVKMTMRVGEHAWARPAKGYACRVPR